MVGWKCFAILYRPRTLPRRSPILSAPTSRPAFTAARIGGHRGLGGVQQLGAFTGPQVGQGRVPAGDQAFPGMVGSAVFPSNTRTATGHPAGSVSTAYSICGRFFFPSRE